MSAGLSAPSHFMNPSPQTGLSPELTIDQPPDGGPALRQRDGKRRSPRCCQREPGTVSLIHISEPTRLALI
eukprot:5880744-Alexandrium_andersonii.AAC.1